jgi:hypothetical protein
MLTLVFTRNVTVGRTVALLYPLRNLVGEGITMYKVWSKKDVDFRVFTRMLRGKNLTVTLTFDLENR